MAGPRFLFSSDFHSREEAFRLFAAALARDEFDAGILAGDLLDEWMPPEQVALLAGSLGAALEIRRAQLQTILETARKPIFFVLGNHDVTPWPDSQWLTNLHGRAVEFQSWRLVGYRWTRMDRYPDEIEADFEELNALVDAQTILVTHSPPWGVLDGVPGGRFRYGLKMLHRLTPPRLHLFGHVHETAGVQGNAVNGSWPALRRFFAVDDAGAVLDGGPIREQQSRSRFRRRE